MRQLFQYRAFRRLWFSGLVSQFGDWLLAIALPVHLYQLTGSTLATGAAFVAQSVPRLVLGIAAGVFVDRWEHRCTLVVTDLARACSVLALLLVQSPHTLWLLYACVACDAVLALFAVPAQQAILPLVVVETEIGSANSLRAVSWEVTRLLAPPIGGMVFVAWGFSWIVVLDSISFLASALLARGITMFGGPLPDTQPAEAALFRVWSELKAGLQSVHRSSRLLIVCGVGAMTMLAEGVMNVLGYPWLQQVLGGGALERGWLATAQAVGGLLGGVGLAWVLRHAPLPRVVSGSAVITGVLAFVLARVAEFPIPPGLHWPLALLLKGLTGVGIVGFSVGLSSLLLMYTQPELRGRVLACYSASSAAAVLVGQVVASTLGDTLGVVTLLSLQSGCYIVAGVLAVMLRRESWQT